MQKANPSAFYGFLLTFLPLLLLPLLSICISAWYGHFLWGDFYRLFFWVMFLAFLLQSGSRQLLGEAYFDDDLENEFRLGLKSRIAVLLIFCLLLLLLPYNIRQTLLLASLLKLRFGGDVLTTLHRIGGNIYKVIVAESAFWFVLVTGILLATDSLSTFRLLVITNVAALVRVLLGDPRLLFKIGRLPDHAPDLGWLKESFLKFLPQLSSFLFYSIDILVASLLLTTIDFSYYQVTMALTIAAGILFNLIYSSLSGRHTATTITVASLVMVPVVMGLRFTLAEYSGIELTPWYLLAAYTITLSLVISAVFIRKLLQDRQIDRIRNIFFSAAFCNAVALVLIFKFSDLQTAFLVQGGIQFTTAVRLGYWASHK